jgi:UPF0755 protein
MARFEKKLKLVLLIVIVFSIFYSINASKDYEVVVVEYTGSTQEIITDLYNEGYIKNKLSYFTALLLSKVNKDLEPGGYALSKNMGALALHARLVNPDYKYVRVEAGLRKEQIAAAFGGALEWEDEKMNRFASNLPLCTLTGGEGYLFPSTYLVHKNEIISVIKQQMTGKMSDVLESLVGDSESVANIYDAVIIASLIQKEAAGKHDMNLISGVIWNRLFKGMPLQIDATLQYAKADESLWWPRVWPKDKYIDSPYNTYQNKGLPPGPIANPSEAALAAAFNPLNTDCLFYIHDRNRNIHCSSNYAGHQQNINYYLK